MRAMRQNTISPVMKLEECERDVNISKNRDALFHISMQRSRISSDYMII
jgi:hypothetical protein